MNQASTSRSKDTPTAKNGETEFSKRLTISETAPLLTPSGECRTFLSMDMNQAQKLSFGLGHVINDITGVLWFSYTLLFLQFVVHLSSTTSATLLCLGQFTDAIVTPFVGILVAKYGSKKKWHILGVALIAIGFPFVFHYWSYSPYWFTVTKYALAIIIFQLGWTLVQTAHLSLIPEMTLFLQERVKLTTLRYTIFVCSNIAIYLIAYFVLRGGRGRNSFNIVDSRDADKFEIIATVAVNVGVVSALLFQGIVRVPTSTKATKQSYVTDPIRWREILRICWSSKMLHYVAIVHTASRVFHSLNLVYLPFYINEVGIPDSGVLAMAPFFSFVGSLIASVLISYTTKIYTNHKILYTTGIVFSLLSCLCLLVNNESRFLIDSSLVYTASLFYGLGSSLTIVKSLSIAANFVGTNTEDAAFMYGVITFFDKIINGIIIFFVEYLKGTSLINYYHYYKFVLTILSGFVIVIGCVFLQLLPSSICYASIECA